MSGPHHCPECGAELSHDLYTADKMRQAFFASLHETWASFSPDMKRRFPSSEVLRKQALIAIGHCDVMTVTAGSETAALEVAKAFQFKDQYCICDISGSVVTMLSAKSMARRALKKPQFREVSQAVSAWIAEQTGIDPRQHREAA